MDILYHLSEVLSRIRGIAVGINSKTQTTIHGVGTGIARPHILCTPKRTTIGRPYGMYRHHRRYVGAMPTSSQRVRTNEKSVDICQQNSCHNRPQTKKREIGGCLSPVFVSILLCITPNNLSWAFYTDNLL